MKKTTLFSIALVLCIALGAQNLLYTNGPLITHPGQGAGGADVSGLDTNLHSTYGFRVANTTTPTTFRCADDFTIAGNGWVIDSVIFFGYQTNSTTASTINTLDFMIWSGAPDASTILYGDSSTNVLDATYWTGIYRARHIDLLNVARPIMAVGHKISPPLTLNAGTYFIDYRLAGSLTSGPWVPPVSIPSTVSTGDMIQKNGGAWATAIDVKSGQSQGMPFLLKGYGVGINELNSISSVDVYPNPMSTSATVAISFNTLNTNISDLSFVMYDVLGNQVMNIANLSSQRFEISRGNLASGVYLFQVKSSTGVLKTGKISVE